MRRNLGMTIAAILLAGLTVQRAWPSPVYQPPELTRAGNIAFPLNVMKTGMVTLLVNLDSSGNVQNLDVLQDVPGLTSVASDAVKTWGFKPATLDGQSVSSVLLVNVVFNPFNPAGVGNESLTIPLSQAAPAANSDYIPPQITAATFAKYPVNSVASGSVAFDITVGKSGDAAKVRVVRSVPALTAPAGEALKNWTFSAATFKGAPVASHVAVAYVFPTPGTASY